MKEEDVFLSFIITTYKRSEWLGECLSSISTAVGSYQKTGGNKKLEIVVCDDDPDQCKFPIDQWNLEFEKTGVHFVYNINSNNLGDYFNRNEGVKLASGKWIKFIDDDDLVYDWSVSFIIEKLMTSREANTVIFYLRDNFRHLQFPVVLKDKEIFDFHHLQYGLFHCSLVSAVFLKDDIIASGGFKFKRFYGDFQIFHDMATNGCFFIYPLELGWYRTHDNQESNNNRQSVLIRFNYLLYSFDYFMRNDPEDKRFFTRLKNDNLAFARHAIKRLQVELLKKVVTLHRYMLRYEKTKKIPEGWDEFYLEELRYGNNEIKTGAPALV